MTRAFNSPSGFAAAGWQSGWWVGGSGRPPPPTSAGAQRDVGGSLCGASRGGRTRGSYIRHGLGWGRWGAGISSLEVRTVGEGHSTLQRPARAAKASSDFRHPNPTRGAGGKVHGQAPGRPRPAHHCRQAGGVWGRDAHPIHLAKGHSHPTKVGGHKEGCVQS